jgi:hypothetical protein
MDLIAVSVLDLPHSELRHPADPAKRLTIRQHRNASAVSGVPLRIPLHQNMLYEFLPGHRAVVNGRGPTIKGIVYSSKDGMLMERLRSMSAGDAKVEGRKLVFRRDPYDVSRVFWQEPGSIRWHVLTAVGQDGQFLHPFSDQWWHGLREVAGHAKLSKNASVAVAKRNHAMVKALQRLSTNKDEQAREFQRLMNAVPDPQPLGGSSVPETTSQMPPGQVWVTQNLETARVSSAPRKATVASEEFEDSGDLDAFTEADFDDDLPW